MIINADLSIMTLGKTAVNIAILGVVMVVVTNKPIMMNVCCKLAQYTECLKNYCHYAVCRSA